MRKHKLPYMELINKLNFYIDTGQKYSYERAGQSVTLTPENGVPYYSHTLGFNTTNKKDKKNTKLPKNETYFINKVKTHIENNKLYKKIKPNYTNQDDIKFFDYNREIRENDVYTRPRSIDVVKAYFSSSLMEGWITQELFDEGLTKDKRIMLAALGHWAKRTDKWKFDGKNEKPLPTIEPKYPHVFFNQANTIFKIMEECKNAIGDKFLFYWTDGVYVADQYAADICSNIIFINGFSSKETALISIKRTEKSFISKEWNKDDKKVEKKEYKIGLR